MSRTYRFRKSSFIPWWNNYSWREWEPCTKEEYLSSRYDTRIGYYSLYRGLTYEKRLTAQKLKAVKARQRRDDTFRCKEPPKSKLRNLFEERPLRRYNSNELRKYILNPLYDPIIVIKSNKRMYYL